MIQIFDRWLTIKPFVEKGLSDYKIAPLVGISRQMVQRLRKKFHNKDFTRPPDTIRSPHNWDDIQKSYDDGNSWRQLSRIYKISMKSIQLARQRGDIKTYRNPKEGLALTRANGKFNTYHPTIEQRIELSKRQSVQNRGGRSKWYEVGGKKVQGMWERDLAIKFNEWELPWDRVNGKNAAWPYYLDGKLKHYTPDFCLPSFDCWVETKGYWWGDDKRKMDAVLKQYPDRRIVIVQEKEFTLCINSDKIPDLFKGH